MNSVNSIQRALPIDPAKAAAIHGIALIGHSHSRVIFNAARLRRLPLAGRNLWRGPNPATTEDGTGFHPMLADAIARPVVFSALGGSEHIALGLVRHARAFDFVLPARPDLALEDGAEILPLEVVRNALLAQMRPNLDMLALLRRVAPGRVCHILPPPPVARGDALLPTLQMAFPGAPPEVSPAPLRLKLWLLAAATVAEDCERIGVALLAPPAGTTDDLGYLDERFLRDAVHANSAYGALVLEQMLEAA